MITIWLSLILPVILTAVLLSVKTYRERTAIWEPIIPFAVVLLFIGLFSWWGTSSVTKDYEYWGNYVEQTRYYEAWDEYIHQTCTRSYPCGTDSNGNTEYCTETYDCSYVLYHSAYYTVVLNSGSELNVTQEYYNSLVSKFGTGQRFVDMGRDYHYNDGDMYKTNYPDTYQAFEPWMSKHSYTNKVQASASVFNFPDVSEEDVIEFNLFEYPEPDNAKLDAILTHGYPVPQAAQDKFNYLNGKLGMGKQIRVWVLLFNANERSSVYMQRGYWKGGNKNEFIICLGMNKDGTVAWYEPMGWNKEKLIEVETRDYVLSDTTLDLVAFGDFMYKQIEDNWMRTEFEEFDYLSIAPPRWAILMAWILSFLACAGIGIWIVVNDYTAGDPRGYRGKYFSFKRRY